MFFAQNRRKAITAEPVVTEPTTPTVEGTIEPPLEVNGYFAYDTEVSELPEIIPTILVAEEWAAKMPFDATKRYNIVSGPVGMTIGNRTAVVRWTPTPDQVGTHEITYKDGTENHSFTLTVEANPAFTEDLTLAGWIAPVGEKNGDGEWLGSAFEYAADFRKFRTSGTDYTATKNVIYLRGGVYARDDIEERGYAQIELDYDAPLPATADSLRTIQLVGTADNPVIVRPWGNERPTIRGGVNNSTLIRLHEDSAYVTFEGIEFKGESDHITYEEAIADWWIGSDRLTATGFAIGGSHITVRNCVFHEILGQAAAFKNANDVLIEDCVLANSARWTTAGTTAIGFVNMRASAKDRSEYANIMRGNLIHGVESRIYSRVFQKELGHLTLDEGEGILTQPSNAGGAGPDPYRGHTLIENNCLMWCGKGIVINGQTSCDSIRNTIYNVGTTITGRSKCLRSNQSNAVRFERNLIKSLSPGAGGTQGAWSSIADLREWSTGTSYNGGTPFWVEIPAGSEWKDSKGTILPTGVAVLSYNDRRTASETAATFNIDEAKAATYEGEWEDAYHEGNYATEAENDDKVKTGCTFLPEVFEYPNSNDPTPVAAIPADVGADAAHHLNLIDRARSYSVNIEPDKWWETWLKETDEGTGLTGWQQQTKDIVDGAIAAGLTVDDSNWQTTLPYYDADGKHDEFIVPITDGTKTLQEVIGVDTFELSVVWTYTRE